MSSSETVRIILALDESGSMEQNKLEVISGVNKFIEEQINTGGECLFSLIKFSSTVNPLWSNIPIQKMSLLTPNLYKPDNMTALYDTIGHIFKKNEDTKNIILVIMTDGIDNSSKVYTKKSIHDLINKYKTEHNWKIIYLAADPTLSSQGEDIGLNNCHNTINMNVDYSGLSSFLPSLSRNISAYRTGASTNINI